MPKFLTVADSNYSRGMNTVDDPKILRDGECVELVNALPGYPLVVRKGCAARELEFLEAPVEGEVTGKPFYAHFGGQEVLFFWLYKDYLYSLRAVMLDNDAKEESEAIPVFRESDNYHLAVGKEEGDFDFGFVKIGDIVYTRASNGNMWAIEWDDVRALFLARMVPSASNPGYMFSSITGFNPVTATGGDHKGPFIYGYSITLVRRDDMDDPQYSPKTYHTGVIEQTEYVKMRRAIIHDGVSDTTESTLTVTGSYSYPHAQEFGYTHVRLYRTANLTGLFGNDDFMTAAEWSGLTYQEKLDVIEGAERYFLIDIEIDNSGAFSWIDDIPDGALSGEMNLLEADMYTMPPRDGYRMYYHKDRLFICGDKGSVYFSEIPGGDGGGNLEAAQFAGDKYALWFKPLHYRLDLDVEEQTPVVGIRALGDDLFFFKGDSVFMVVGGNPLTAPVRKINDMFGCPFPDTIINAVVAGEETLFYLSGAGPVLVRTGGNYKPFVEFKVRGLWAHVAGELLREARENVEYCSAAFWADAVWVFYKRAGRVARIYGYLSRENVSGAFAVEIGGAIADRCALRGIAVTDTNRAVSVCANGGGVNLFVDFLGAAGYDDELGEGASARVAFRLYSRMMYPGPQERNMSELFRAITYCDFDGSDTFSFVVFNNRYTATFDYARNGVEGERNVWENNMPHRIENLRRCVSFTLPADFVGEYFQYMVEKTVPEGGNFRWYGCEMEALPRPQLDAENFIPVTRMTMTGICEGVADVCVGVTCRIGRSPSVVVWPRSETHRGAVYVDAFAVEWPRSEMHRGTVYVNASVSELGLGLDPDPGTEPETETLSGTVYIGGFAVELGVETEIEILDGAVYVDAFAVESV